MIINNYRKVECGSDQWGTDIFQRYEYFKFLRQVSKLKPIRSESLRQLYKTVNRR
jgi:hypothetical protein